MRSQVGAYHHFSQKHTMRLIQPIIGVFFLLAAIGLNLLAIKDGLDAERRWSIAARTRFKIGIVFTVVGITLVGFSLV